MSKKVISIEHSSKGIGLAKPEKARFQIIFRDGAVEFLPMNFQARQLYVERFLFPVSRMFFNEIHPTLKYFQPCS